MLITGSNAIKTHRNHDLPSGFKWVIGFGAYLDMRDSETNIGGAYTATFNQKGLLAAMKVGYAF